VGRGVAELARVGGDVECVALARSVRWHLEHRVLLHRDRTVVFR
jgi:formyltetrahydrofolate deformylase